MVCDVATRFWDKVSKTDGCWLWNGMRTHSGYGRFRIGGKICRAHRIAWELVYGTIPEGIFVLHKCDNRVCVNPEHLFLGSHNDNMKDMVKKNRQATGMQSGHYTHPERTARGIRSGRYTHPERTARGEGHGRAKLTWDQVNTIRATDVSRYGTQSELAREYRVTPSQIWFIRSGRQWKGEVQNGAA